MQGSTTTLWQSSAHNQRERVSYCRMSAEGHMLSLTTGTLLNRLFDTTFDIMDESKRQQTTKGG